jgi:hypothetical protein
MLYLDNRISLGFSMSAVTNALSSVMGGVGKLLGLTPSAPTPIAAPVTPTVDNSYQAMDAAAQQQAASLARGRTSTLLTSAQGEDEDQLKTSKIVLGS